MAVTVDVLDAEVETPWIYGKWVEPPVQNRSERTFFRFLDAAESLLSQRHWHEVSVQDIVKGADASVGSFYNRFNDKTALLHCLDDRLGQECELTIEQLLGEIEACPLLVGDAPAIFISLLVRLCTERRGVIRALDVARKMSTNDGFTGLGPRFADGLDVFSKYLIKKNDALGGCSVAVVSHAFQEVFMIARESLLYRPDGVEGADLHKTLMRYFTASLAK